MALVDDFKARFPEFTPATVDSYWTALEVMWPAYYSANYTSAPTNQSEKTINEAIFNLIAHLFIAETDPDSASFQQAQSQSVGSVSESFQQGAQSSGLMTDFFRATKYGQRFLILTARNYGGIAV